MHRSPDEIQRRTFAIEDRGYDRDEVRVFLLEVASTLRLALHTTRPPISTPPAAEPAAAPAGGDGGDDFTRLGAEVAEVLRAAHDAVAVLRNEAALEIEAQHQDAQARADELRRQADADAAWTHERAKRVLVTAQEQADALLADAERAGAELIEAARRQAEDHTAQVAERTRRHAEQILRAERDALRRLHQAQAGVAAAVEMLTGSESRPVVDLTELRPNLRLGSLSIEIEDTDADDEGGQEGHDAPGEPTRPSHRSPGDPVAHMVRHAVDRAVEHARRAAPDDEPPSGPDGTTDLAPDPASGSGSTGRGGAGSRPVSEARRAAATAASRARGVAPVPDGRPADRAPADRSPAAALGHGAPANGAAPVDPPAGRTDRQT